MKLSAVVFLSSVVASATAFAPPKHQQRMTFATASRTPLRMSATEEDTAAPSAAAESDFGSAMPAAGSAYERMGITEDQLAIGIDPTDVLQWLGTRSEIVDKFLRDNKNFDQARAESEVDKFLLDGEMLTAWINYERKKATNPVDLKQEAIDNFSDPRTILTYVAWIAGGVGFSIVRQNYVEPKFASGEWEPIHVNIDGLFGKGAETAADAVDAATSSIAETAADAVDAASSSL